MALFAALPFLCVALMGAMLVMLIALVRKIVLQNSEPGGILCAWQPTIWGAIREAAIVVVWWLPFGIASVLLFHMNGLLVGALNWALTLGVRQLQHGTIEAASVAGDIHGQLSTGFISYLVPDGARDVVHSFKAELSSLADFLAHLLVVLAYVLVIESWLSWAFLVWLTIRSVTYMVARRAMSRPEIRDTECRFDMEFLR